MSQLLSFKSRGCIVITSFVGSKLLDIRKANQSRERSNGGESENSGYHDLGVPPHIQILNPTIRSSLLRIALMTCYLDYEYWEDAKEEVGSSVEYRGNVRNDNQD
jgi:hypothetical protein